MARLRKALWWNLGFLEGSITPTDAGIDRLLKIQHRL